MALEQTSMRARSVAGVFVSVAISWGGIAHAQQARTATVAAGLVQSTGANRESKPQPFPFRALLVTQTPIPRARAMQALNRL